jgi:RNA polymerase sigma-70 factor (ECF subfamily)
VPLDEEEGREVPSPAGTPESLLIDRTQEQLLQSAIAELPLHFREILLLCDVEEMSYKEIADALSLPIGTVMSRLSRARKALREILQEKIRG